MKLGIRLVVIVMISVGVIHTAEQQTVSLPAEMVQEILVNAASLADAVQAVRSMRQTSTSYQALIDGLTERIITQLATSYQVDPLTVALLINTPVSRSIITTALNAEKKKSAKNAQFRMSNVLTQALQHPLTVQQQKDLITQALNLGALIRHIEGIPLPNKEWLWRNEVGVQDPTSLDGLALLVNRTLAHVPSLERYQFPGEFDFAIHRTKDGSFVHAALSHLESDSNTLYIADFSADLKLQSEVKQFKVPYLEVNLIAIYPSADKQGYVVAFEQSNGTLLFTRLTLDGQWTEIGVFKIKNMVEILYPAQYKKEFGQY